MLCRAKSADDCYVSALIAIDGSRRDLDRWRIESSKAWAERCSRLALTRGWLGVGFSRGSGAWVYSRQELCFQGEPSGELREIRRSVLTALVLQCSGAFQKSIHVNLCL